jgi:hypothetical protein
VVVRAASLLLLVLASMTSACSRESMPGGPAPSGPVRFVPAGEGRVAALVRDARAREAREHRRLLVYVGATWCEPCVAFHEAATRGELDRLLPGLTLLEFDLDRDGDRLLADGYGSPMIPLFAVPGPDGKASGRYEAGARKGGNWVDDITPRLEKLLGGGAVR